MNSKELKLVPNASGGVNIPEAQGIGVGSQYPVQAPAPQGEQLDPSVVSLAKSIGKKESGGNYNSPRGKDGELGAYQFTRGFIDTYAPKYLGQYDPENLSPDQQDKLAYETIKEWGTNGKPGYEHLGKLSPAQIASAWNAGDPNAYLEPHSGTSAGGARYDTNKYVEDIKSNYDKATQPEQKTGLSEFDRGITIPTAIGVGALAAGAGAMALPETGLGGALGELWQGAKNIGGNIVKGAIGNTVADLVKQNLPQQAQQILPQSQHDFASIILGQEMPKASEASNTIASTIAETMAKTPSGRALMQDPNMQEAVNTNGKYGFAPEVIDGALDFHTAYKKSKETLGKLSDGVASALQDESSPMAQAMDSAKRNLREYAPSNEWDEGDKVIGEEATKYAVNFGKVNGKSYKQFLGKQEDNQEARNTFAQHATISHAHLERMKKEMWHGQKFNIQDTTATRAAKKALGFGAKSTISANTQHKDFYNSALKEEQRIINGQKIMKRLNGKKSPEHYSVSKSLLHAGGRYVAMYIGDKIGGPMGAILGDMIGRHIVGAVDKAKGKTIFETPAVQKAIEEVRKDHPEYYTKLVELLKKEGINIAVKKELHRRMHKEGFVKKSIESKKRKVR